MFNKINPFRAPTEVKIKDKSQLSEALEKMGKHKQWDVEKLTAETVLNHFKRSKGDILRETAQSARIGARKVGIAGAIAGAVGGGAFGIVGSLIAGIAFPPSLLAIGITVAIGAVKGTVVGGLGGMLLGGLLNGAKTALYLTLTSPKMRLNRSARNGRKELDRLEGRHMAKELKGKKLKRLEFLREHVPLWEYAAHNLQTGKAEQKVEKLAFEMESHKSEETLIKLDDPEMPKTGSATQTSGNDIDQLLMV